MFSIIRRQGDDISKLAEKFGIVSNARKYAGRMGFGEEYTDYLIVNEKVFETIKNVRDFDDYKAVGQKDEKDVKDEKEE